ncbi:cytochrome b/b6 domain-containing protein [Agaribacter marinus]|uniref:Cytochrome b561 n=1 Tax=Agaribacter marinus TaxID=1431249 RepID=A0AA37SZ46_9ALTE|nr:cytochrome b/b6 domain-containing protein [Agaribacter marinus]GLR70586.1 cytochrome b561 [Agaribacter marinus]
MHQVIVWDFPTRAFHWLLVMALIFQYVSGDILDDAMQWHFYVGYFTLGLLVFRVVWGVVGHTYSRFTYFVCSPKTVFNYLQGQDTREYLTHNPVGALSTIALLTLFLTQAVSGLFISDDIFYEGPWHSAASDAMIDTANFLHGQMYILLMSIALIHVLAVLFYQFKKKQPLVQSMVHGKKPSVKAGHKPKPLNLLFALMVVALSAGALYLIVEVLPPPVEDSFYDY